MPEFDGTATKRTGVDVSNLSDLLINVAWDQSREWVDGS